MIVRLKTSKEAKEKLDNLNKVLHMSSNAIVLRYAIAMSLICDTDINDDPTALVKNNSGFEISRITLFGENDTLYRVLMGVYDPNDDKTFMTLANMHIERGLSILEREYQLAGNKDKFIMRVLNNID